MWQIGGSSHNFWRVCRGYERGWLETRSSSSWLGTIFGEYQKRTEWRQDNLYHALSCSAENIHFLSKSYLMQMVMIWNRAKSVPGKCEKSLCVTTAYFSFSDPQTRCCIVCCSHRCAWWKRAYIPGLNYLKYLFNRHTRTNFSQSFVIYHLETLNGKSYVWYGTSTNLE